MGGKVDLSKGYWNPKRKMWVATHFSEIIKQPYFQESAKIQRMYGNLFPNLSSIISEKMRGYPQFSFWTLVTLVKICYFRIVINCLVDKFLKKLEYPEMRRTYAQY